MSKIKFWNIPIGEMHYAIEYDPTTFAGRKRVMINGSPVALKIPLFSDITGFDQVLYLGNKAVHLVIINGIADLAIDGYFLNSQKPYAPLPKMPVWTWIFIVASLAIPVVTLGGAIPGMIGGLGAAVNAKIAYTQKWNTQTRILICVLATGVAWALLYLFIEIMTGLM